MANKYINAICAPSYGAVDSARDKQMKSIGLGLLLGSVALVAVPAILMSSGSMKKYGSFFFSSPKKKMILTHWNS